jgi:RNA polymerase sigma factor (sigma-70 family)
MLQKDTESKVGKRVRLAAEVFDAYGDEIRAIISLNVKDKSVADDIFQDIFLSLVRNPIPPDLKCVGAYLYRIVTNDVIDAARRIKRRQDRIRRCGECSDLRATQEPPCETLIRFEDIRNLFQLIERRLRPHEAEAVIHDCIYGHNADNGAKEMGVERRTFSRYLCIGLKKIRQHLRENRGDENGYF